MFDTAFRFERREACAVGRPTAHPGNRPRDFHRACHKPWSPRPAIGDAADKFMAIAANQAARRASLRSRYDHIVIGFVCAAETVTILAPTTQWKAEKSRAAFIHTDSFGERWKKFLQRASLIDREPGQAQ